MDIPDGRFSRISKLLLDRDATAVETAMERRRAYGVTLCCGGDMAQSYTLQLAVLTAANIAIRCFPGAVKVALAPDLVAAPLLLWPSLKWTFGQALVSIVGPAAIIDSRTDIEGSAVVFGNASPKGRALRATFDGWIARVGPATAAVRLPEREYCVLAGVLAGAFAIAELFLEFAELDTLFARWRAEVLEAVERVVLRINPSPPPLVGEWWVGHDVIEGFERLPIFEFGIGERVALRDRRGGVVVQCEFSVAMRVAA